MQPPASKEEILSELAQRAVATLGQEKAEALRGELEVAAKRLWLLNNDPLDREVEPAFFFRW